VTHQAKAPQQDDDEGGAVSDQLGVLPIVGAAGLGRTTLVQHVCEDPAVRRRFSLVMMLDFHCMSLMAAAGETAMFLRSLFAPMLRRTRGWLRRGRPSPRGCAGPSWAGR